MADIAKHIRIFEPNATDEFVDKRVNAVKAIEVEFKKKKNIDDRIILADSFGNLLLNFTSDPQSIATSIAAAIRKQSTSFVAEGAELEIITCGLLALVQWIETEIFVDPLAVNDVMAISLWSCFSFQKPLDTDPKLEVLRKELIGVCQSRITKAAIHNRKRTDIKVVANIAPPVDNTIATLSTYLSATYGKVINDLRKNAVLDREEIDCLWWVLSEWSDLADCSLRNLNPIQRAIISAVEFASILRRVPGTSQRNLLLRNLEIESTLDVNELLAELGDMVNPIKVHLSRFSIISRAPLVFPLFNIIYFGSADIEGSDIKRPITDWVLRALVEGSMINFNTIVEDAK